jgi:hypothetical protein
MLKRIMIASAGLLLLGACQQPAPLNPGTPATRNSTVYFNTGSAALSAESQATVAQAANAFKAGGRSVAVSGHTDTTGPADYNLQLSRQRAAAVSDALQRNGVPGNAIAALGYGEQDLPVPTAQNVAERRNRSVDIAISDRTAGALMSDSEYCKALSATYRRYRAGNIEEVPAVAMTKCETTEAASAIPLLEKSLTDNRIPIPARAPPRA